MLGGMVRPPTAQDSVRPYVCPCGATIVKVSNSARCADADIVATVCCRKMLDVSLVVVVDASRPMVHRMDGRSSNDGVFELHGVVGAAPAGGVATMPIANAGSGAPTKESRTGCEHNCAVSRMAGMERCNDGGASPDVRRQSITKSTVGVVVAVCT